MRVAIVGTYPPTRCGIATFTADVESALSINATEVVVVPVVTEPSADLVIVRDDPQSYVEAAQRVNELGCDVALIQHEFGIFGRVSGNLILRFAAELEMPYVVTLHTVLPHFDDEQGRVVEE
ncbi:MAG TPA: hypothetical protein VH761_13950, partial [Ilumatobacteraceae bacterium]